MAVFNGTAASERIDGTSGNDTFRSSGGQDFLYGHGGYDKAIIDYSASTQDHLSHLISSTDGILQTSFNGPNFNQTNTSIIEEIDYRGGVGSETADADVSGIAGTWKISLNGGGGGGFDVITVHFGNAAVTGTLNAGVLSFGRLVLTGFEQFYLTLGGGNDDVGLGDGDDRVEAGNGDDRASGGAGSDQLEGGWGADRLIGGDGNDALFSDHGFSVGDHRADVDVVDGGAGDDQVIIGYGDSADGGPGSDRLSLSLQSSNSGVTLDLSALFAGGTVTVGGGTLEGLESYDQISGSDFADTLTLGNGAYGGSPDFFGINGFGGGDTITTGLGADSIYGGAGDDIVHAGDGADLAVGGDANDRLYGDGGDDELWGDTGDDELRGGAGNDRLTGGDGADELYGEAGDDRLEGGTGVDVLAGGAGNDLYFIAEPGDSIVEAAGDGTDTAEIINSGWTDTAFTLAPGVAVERLIGVGDSPMTLRLTGNAFAQQLIGTSGIDVLNGGGGADTMTGLYGNDTYYVDNAGDKVIEQEANGGSDRVLAKGSYALAANQRIETLATTSEAGTLAINLTGNGFANAVTGNAGANVLDGGGGADTLRGLGGDDTYRIDSTGDKVVEAAGGGTDTVESRISFTLGANVERLTLTGTAALGGTGNALDNILTGNAAANLLNGAAGADTMRGGAGDDIYVVDSAADRIVELAGQGTDTVRSAISLGLADHVEALILTGGAAVNATGNALANNLTGNGAANRLNGGAGADTMAGGLGHDLYVVDHAGDRVIENGSSGTDAVQSSIDFRLPTHVEKLVLAGSFGIDGRGNSGANTITGNAGSNFLNGGSGNDLIDAGPGNDRILGAAGTDSLKGGTGLDRFEFTTALSAANVDKILDFSVANDSIYLLRSVFSRAGANGALAPSAFRQGTAAADASDRIVYDQATGKIFYDEDGSGAAAAAILFATVTAGTALTAADFVIYG